MKTLLAATLLLTTLISAQQKTEYFKPNALFGGSFYINSFMLQFHGAFFTEGNFAYYGALAVTPGKVNEDHVYDNISYHKAKYDFRDKEKGNQYKDVMFDIGTVYNASKIINLYLAVSIQERSEYKEFYDEFQILGDNGKYYLSPTSKFGIGLSGGIMFSISPKVGLVGGGTIGVVNNTNIGLTFFL